MEIIFTIFQISYLILMFFIPSSASIYLLMGQIIIFTIKEICLMRFIKRLKKEYRELQNTSGENDGI